MTNAPSQHALREVRRLFSSPITRMVLIALVFLLGISGPFGTLESMGFGARVAYWAVTAPATFAIGVIVSAFMAETLRERKPDWAMKALVALVAAIAITIFVVLFNWIAFGQTPIEISKLPALVLSVTATAAVIALVLQYIPDSADSVVAAEVKLPPLLDRLDLEKRGAIISLSVQDHYVEVTTNKGTSLVLMRLSDAIRETSPIDGIQIHRSHWVAVQHITSVKRDGDRAILTLSDGRDLPASRSNIKLLKERALLPR
ncbi:LytTR family DNA-binding domain-containing protein [Planktotalea sp.]|uniref:LytTR family DNA-binding domain-containing protein n=1 Tax=Planktotalea sp. TaxID=2029877 RepID=UPI003298D4CB